ncbi:PaaI family thioesterase [uncultured Endozoicomonas sp.]|uniref:PaaI family thioesterase n=1 Tax=uncultured Endozoicomonas sp. TaxID=432652 RepID=UPI002636489A|nr:PaaI family thioesterase [uncultured Endozoicomonas sp.]
MPTDEQLNTFAGNFIKMLPHCHHLNMSLIHAAPDGVEMEMPYDARLVGNPETGVIHSGVITTLMDSCSGVAVYARLSKMEACPTLDLRIDHLTTAEPEKPIRAFAEVYHMTDSMVFVRGVAFQESKEKPFAHSIGTFMRLGKEGLNPKEGRS